MYGNTAATASNAGDNVVPAHTGPTGHDVNQAFIDNLNSMDKDQLIQMVISLSNTVSKIQKDYAKVVNLRLYNLERNFNMSQQYLRRDSLEITGIPSNINDDQIEAEVIDIFKEAKVTVNRQPLKPLDIQAAHRIGSKGKVIVKVVNRKFVRSALVKGKNLKGSKRYGVGTRLYLNDSFTPEFGHLNYLVRNSYKDGYIHKYKVRNGVTLVQKTEDDDFTEIAHAMDLANMGIDVPNRIPNGGE